MRKKKLSSPASAVRKDMLGGRVTSWGWHRQLREAAWGNGGGRGKSELRLAKKRNEVAGLGRSSAPSRKPAPETSTLGYYTLGLLLAP